MLTSVMAGSRACEECAGGPVGDLKAGVVGSDTLVVLGALEESLECMEDCMDGGSVAIGESKAFKRGEWTLEVSPELGLELRRSSTKTCDEGAGDDGSFSRSFGPATVAFILL